MSSLADIFTAEFTEKLIEDSKPIIAERILMDRKIEGHLILLKQARDVGRNVPDVLIAELQKLVYGRKNRTRAAPARGK